MPTPTYTPIATVTLTSAVPDVIFNNIPATYRDLILVATQGVASSMSAVLRFNTDAGVGNYRYQSFRGNGTTATAYGQATSYIAITETAFTTNTQYQIQILDYSATDKGKTIVGRHNNAANDASMVCGRWVGTAAVNRVWLTFFGINATAGSTFSLYGIVA